MDAYKNRARFWQHCETISELILMAHKQPENLKLQRVVLHAITHQMHELKQPYSNLLNSYELLRLETIAKEAKHEPHTL